MHVNHAGAAGSVVRRRAINSRAYASVPYRAAWMLNQLRRGHRAWPMFELKSGAAMAAPAAPMPPPLLLHSTWLCLTLVWLYFTALHSTLLWLYFILLDSTLLYITLHCFYFTLLDSTLLYYGSTSLYFTVLHSTLLYYGYTSFCVTVCYSTIALLFFLLEST